MTNIQAIIIATGLALGGFLSSGGVYTMVEGKVLLNRWSGSLYPPEISALQQR